MQGKAHFQILLQAYPKLSVLCHMFLLMRIACMIQDGGTLQMTIKVEI
jgi:hypothetical protein